MELLLRMPGSSAEQSPFEDALRRVASGGRLDLAAPYLSVALLRELTSGTTPFRLVTDAEEWLRAFARPARRDILSFIAQHSDHVRHYRDLHAKVALSPTCAMFGSANFTQRGMHERQEVGALVRDTHLLDRLANWYDFVWSRGAPVDVALLSRYERALPTTESGSEGRAKRLLPPPKRAPRSKASSSVAVPAAKLLNPSKREEQRLVARLATAETREWAEHYFEALRRLIEALGLQPNDPRILTPIPSSYPNLTATLNTRGVLYRLKRFYDVPETGAQIIQRDLSTVKRSAIRQRVIGTWPYDPQSGEKETPPIIVAFKDFSFLDEPAVFDDWVSACRVELSRRDAAPRKDLHCPVVVRAALDPAYRQHLFARVNWAND